MKYNAKYGRWFSKDGLIYRYDDKLDKLILCSARISKSGYNRAFDSNRKEFRPCRAIWETFNGEIPDGYEIDHFNTIRTDDRLDNLRCVTHVENMNNPITKEKHAKANREHRRKFRGHHQKIVSDFGRKYFEHYGLHFVDDRKLYNRECVYYHRHGKCSWEA